MVSCAKVYEQKIAEDVEESIYNTTSAVSFDRQNNSKAYVVARSSEWSILDSLGVRLSVVLYLQPRILEIHLFIETENKR